MLKQRRQGYLLLFFTLFFILLCLTQRMSGAPRISLSPSADFTTPCCSVIRKPAVPIPAAPVISAPNR